MNGSVGYSHEDVNSMGVEYSVAGHSARLCDWQHHVVSRPASTASPSANNINLPRRSLRRRNGNVLHRSSPAIHHRRLRTGHSHDQSTHVSHTHLPHLRLRSPGSPPTRARHPAALPLRQQARHVFGHIDVRAIVRPVSLRLPGRTSSLYVLRSDLFGHAASK